MKQYSSQTILLFFYLNHHPPHMTTKCKVIAVSHKNLSECAKQFDDKMQQFFQENPTAIVSSCQSPVLHDRDPAPEPGTKSERFFYASGIVIVNENIPLWSDSAVLRATCEPPAKKKPMRTPKKKVLKKKV